MSMAFYEEPCSDFHVVYCIWATGRQLRLTRAIPQRSAAGSPENVTWLVPQSEPRGVLYKL
jgi:hypothetical protein